jgi:TRAP-type mannitol/chloroaromatic compound transport system permease large subunit
MTRGAAEATLRLSAFVMFILIGARVFALTFYGVNGHIWVKELMLALPGGEVGFLLFVALIVFVLGFFLDFFEIVFILVPLLIAPAEALGIDLVWFGVFLAVNFQTSFLTPPFGFSLFYLRSVAPKKDYIDPITNHTIRRVTTADIYRGVIPFVAIQLLMLLVVSVFPATVTHYRTDMVSLSDEEVLQQLDGLGAPGFEAGGGQGGSDMFAPPSGEMFTVPTFD